MKLISWNCCNGIADSVKAEYLLNLNPDIAVLPELREKDISLLKPSSYVWTTNNLENSSPKGLGVLGFNGTKIEELPRDEEMEIYLPLFIEQGTKQFNLLAVWNFYWAAKQGRFKGNKETPVEYAALQHYQDFFTDPCIIAGDWNLGPTFAQVDYFKILDLLYSLKIKNLYNEFHKIPLGKETHQTFRPARGSNRHILDHLFGSASILEATKEIQVDAFDNVIRSDHAPLILEI